MNIRYLLLIVILLLISKIGVSQWILPSREIVTVYSPNGLFYAKSTPASSLDITMLGKTEVYDSRDSQLLYTIPYCLASGKLFVSNDGQSVLHLLESDYGKHEEPSHTHCFTLYRRDSVLKQLTLRDLTGCNNDSSYCRLYYNVKYNWTPLLNARDSLISEHPVFVIGDTVFVYTAARRLLRIHLPSAQIETLPFDYLTLEQLKNIPEQQCTKDKFKCPSGYAGDDYESFFAKKMGMVPRGDDYTDRYKYYWSSMLLRVDKNGHAEIVSLKNSDKLSEEKIRRAIDRMTFDVADYPDGIDFWHKKMAVVMRKKNKIIAQREGKIERKRQREIYERNLVADSIDGVYIPQNIEDCFRVLDTLLLAKDRKRIYALPSRDSMSMYHFGLGRWLRNNWGLWRGSRLERYFYQRGVYHPDNMSGAILDYYYDHLHSVDSAWQRFDTTLIPPPPPDTATFAVPQYRVKDRHIRRILKRVIDGKTLDPEDEEEIMKKGTMCNMSLIEIDINDTNKIDDISVSDFLNVIKELTDSSISIINPQHILTFEGVGTEMEYRPIYGYVKFHRRFFLLTDKEINTAFFKKTRKTHRFWKPKKYQNGSKTSDRIYFHHDGKWDIVWEQ